MQGSHKLLFVINLCATLLAFCAISAQAQVLRRKDAPIQAPSSSTVSPGGSTPEQRQPDLAVTGPGSRPASYKLRLLADPCALITADEVEEIMKVPHNRALLTTDKPYWVKDKYGGVDFSSVSCRYNLKFVNPLYPEDKEPIFPENAYLDSASFVITFNDQYAQQNRLIIDPKEKQVLEIVNGVGDEALFLVDMTEREKEYGIAGRQTSGVSFENHDSLYVRKGDLLLSFSVWKRVGDYRGKIIQVARKVLERMP
jgi:hypothetical protein